MKRTCRIILSLLLAAALLTALFGCGAQTASPAEMPKAKVRAKTLLLTDYPDAENALTLASLQGALANVSETQILIRDGAYAQYLPYTDAAVSEAQPDGSPWDTASLLAAKTVDQFLKTIHLLNLIQYHVIHTLGIRNLTIEISLQFLLVGQLTLVVFIIQIQ